MCGSCLITHVWFYNSCARYNNKSSCLFQRSIYCESHVLQRGAIALGHWLSIVFVPSINPFQCAQYFSRNVLLILSVSLDGVVEYLFSKVHLLYVPCFATGRNCSWSLVVHRICTKHQPVSNVPSAFDNTGCSNFRLSLWMECLFLNVGLPLC
jgi:hypothetical protein